MPQTTGSNMKTHAAHNRPATSTLLAAITGALLLAAPAAHGYLQDAAEETLPVAAVAEGELVMEFQDATLETILNYLAEEAGLIVVNEADLDERITVFNRQPISLDEAINMLNTVLFEKEFTAIRRGRLLKIVELGDARSQSIPVRFGNDPTEIGESDTMITQVIPIKYADAITIGEDVRDLINEDFASLTSNGSSNALILTDTEANVRRIVEIVSALDKSISQVTEVRVFALEFADADDTARLIEEIFEGAPSIEEAVGRVIQQRFSRGGRGGGGDDDDGAGTGQQGRVVNASPDERTNSIVVSAAPEVMESIASVIEELDSDTTSKESVLIYEVRNMQATDLEELFNSLFEDSSASQNQNFGGQNGGGGRGAQVQAAQIAAAAGDSNGADLVGQVTAVANEDTNTLLVLTPEKNFARLQEILDALDKPVPQVLIRVLVSEVTHDDSLDFGVEFEGINLGSTTDDNIFTDFDLFDSTLGLNYLVFSSDNFRGALRALHATGKFDILSRPYLLTADNQEANINVGESVPIITNSRVDDNGDIISTIEYRDVGIILTVTPQINSEGLVVLDVSQELSAISDLAVPVAPDQNAVVFSQRSLTTQVAVGDGQTVVIGGLMEDEARETITQVPLLGDIPWVGQLFRRTERSHIKTELLLFLTPEVIEDPSELTAMTQRVRQEATDLRDEDNPGLLQQHLDNMQIEGPDAGDGPGEEPESLPDDAAE
ncbi:type II secretion system secretin GspD [Phycisphaeraceae bacterium D3-23]